MSGDLAWRVIPPGAKGGVSPGGVSPGGAAKADAPSRLTIAQAHRSRARRNARTFA